MMIIAVPRGVVQEQKRSRLSIRFKLLLPLFHFNVTEASENPTLILLAIFLDALTRASSEAL